ncbi:MAG: rRNA pseudouridine synthase [Candidatus Tectomicrobia bacterium]|uniref:Pseudouridine synthase n=1 Tax=Tectimicrobiota bacterium TaxID=2528274 RepID=A0A932I540_UNCTE|nr:rRNA pseudouridine synthase [Candidatus Tectomicrobia bacterium]
MSEIRLQKIISQAGVASRREAERLISEGRVTVNGRAVTELGAKADPGADAVKVDGKLITRREPPAYFVMNKPRNVLTTMRDEEEKGRPTVADLLPPGGRRVFPVGRLDFDAEGAILFTNDGELAHRLTHPSFQVPRVYEVKVKGAPDAKALARMGRRGASRPPRGSGAGPEPAGVRLLPSKTESNAWLRIELREGRHHHIKKMCEEAGHPVLKLTRRSFAGVKILGLAPGAVRPLTEAEVARLKALIGLGRPAPSPAPRSREGWALPKSRRPARARGAEAAKGRGDSKPSGKGRPRSKGRRRAP